VKSARESLRLAPANRGISQQTWPRDLGFDVFCRWFDLQHHSMLVDLCDEPLIDELD
jgi:hypothetical protein